MKLEHFALNCADPLAVADWYCRHLGFQIARCLNAAPFTHFLRDPQSGTLLEIYHNPPNEVPDYRAMNPLLLHVAFATEALDTDRNALIRAGATLVSEDVLPDGSRLVMLRDPWGLSLQLCQRAPGFFKGPASAAR